MRNFVFHAREANHSTVHQIAHIRKQSAEYIVLQLQRKCRKGKNCKGCYGLDWKIGNLSLAYETSIQESENRLEETILESGDKCYQTFTSSA